MGMVVKEGLQDRREWLHLKQQESLYVAGQKQSRQENEWLELLQAPLAVTVPRANKDNVSGNEL